MSIIKISDLTFAYDGTYENIFEKVSFQLDTNWKLGFIGRNGKGKTTFLNLLMGKYNYLGKIETTVTFDYFPFDIEDGSQSTLMYMKYIIAPFTYWEEEMERQLDKNTEDSIHVYSDIHELYMDHDGYTINQDIELELNQLQVSLDVLERPFQTLSNGERTKVMLAALFLKKNNFLLIDEPTNHLDTDGRELLANYLKSKKSFIMVSHDRRFLDMCVDHVLAINQVGIEIQQGNFSTWYQNKEFQDNFEINKNEKLKKDIFHLKSAATRTAGWSDKIEKSKIGDHESDRGRVGHLAAKMMKKSKAIEKRQNIAVEEKQKLLKNIDSAGDLKINTLKHHSSRYIEVKNLAINYDNTAIFDPISFELNYGDRLAIKGSNGCGKTSLFKLLIGGDIGFTGEFSVASQLKISYLSQDTSFLSGSLNDFAEINNLDERLLFTVLRQLNFPKTQFEKPLEDYSAGQKKKVLIAKCLVEPAHLFIWDEPLNYIDVLSRIQIENLILKYQPTIIFVEHDISFMEKCATKIVELARK